MFVHVFDAERDGRMRASAGVIRAHLAVYVFATLNAQLAAAAPLRPHPPGPSGRSPAPAATSPSQKFARTLSAVVGPPPANSSPAGGVPTPSGRITKWFVPSTPAMI